MLLPLVGRAVRLKAQRFDKPQIKYIEKINSKMDSEAVAAALETIEAAAPKRKKALVKWMKSELVSLPYFAFQLERQSIQHSLAN
eukprot:SAG11_NODE_7471_length_1139_cov_0.997115_2_plen_85_part_00